jgi:hypothetical protein
MSQALSGNPADGGDFAPPRRKFWRRMLGSRIILLSIAIHLLFGVAATYLIVESIQAKRKLTFQGGPSNPDPSTRALEHQINMTRRQQTMSAPAQARRITTTGLAKISLPEMPSMPAADDITPDKMAGMGGAGAGFGLAGGAGGGGGGGGAGITFFGLHDQGSGLKGTFYDLKQTRGRRPTNVQNVPKFAAAIDTFVNSGWSASSLDQYFRSPVPLYATQFFIPLISSANAPREFGVEKDVQPRFWIAVYEGKISPPESGTYHFVGHADNIIIVRLNGQVALKMSWNYKILNSWRPEASYLYHFSPKDFRMIPPAFGKGNGIVMNSNQLYDIQVLLGDDGGVTHFSLLVEKDGVAYRRTKQGAPILPIFRFSPAPPPPGDQPPYMPDGPIWKAHSQTSSDLDALF